MTYDFNKVKFPFQAVFHLFFGAWGALFQCVIRRVQMIPCELSSLSCTKIFPLDYLFLWVLASLRDWAKRFYSCDLIALSGDSLNKFIVTAWYPLIQSYYLMDSKSSSILIGNKVFRKWTMALSQRFFICESGFKSLQ